VETRGGGRDRGGRCEDAGGMASQNGGGMGAWGEERERERERGLVLEHWREKCVCANTRAASERYPGGVRVAAGGVPPCRRWWGRAVYLSMRDPLGSEARCAGPG
jgi:hypothetical protein